jgi:8-oxo-dGTP pyrophosphatase MutT (NUDIX family)/phosphohistidine phosphatase SixA
LISVATILAAGAVLWRATEHGAGVEVALVHRPRYDDWTLPKGKVDPGETVPAAAVREIAEETGFRAALGRHLRTVDYLVGGLPKRVEYFAARAVDDAVGPEVDADGMAEVDELNWLAPSQARRQLTYPHDRSVLDEFTRIPHDTTTLLLVRHAKAGSRQNWQGDDDLRPLSNGGIRQAAALRRLLPLFGVDRVHSAPPVRCAQTVREVADDLGTAIVSEPLLAEEGYWVDPPAGVARLMAIAAAGGTPVVSSQGGVIPDVVAALAQRSGLGLGTVESKKGSVWVLSFVPLGPAPYLVAADYLVSPLAYRK